MFRINLFVVAVVVLCVCGMTVQAGVTLDVAVDVNSQGNDIYTVTATSDGEPITSLGVHIEGEGNIAVDPYDHIIWTGCPVGDFCAPFPQYPSDLYTYLLFNPSDSLLIAAGGVTSVDLFDINLTGFPPFESQEFLQIVLTGGDARAVVGVVAGGELFELDIVAQGQNSALVPEPINLVMVAMGAGAMMRRKR